MIVKRILGVCWELSKGLHRGGARVGRIDASPQKASQSVPVFSLLTRGDPYGSPDVCAFSAVLRNVEDLLHERGIDLCHETVRLWWNRFGPLFAADIRRQRVSRMRGYCHWRWHVDEVYVRINGEMLESYVTKKRDKSAALRFLKKALKRHGRADIIVTDGLKSYPAAMRNLGIEERREVGRHLNNRAENSDLPFRRRERAMLRSRQMKSLQKFASVHASNSNHFQSQRHLVDRQIYKALRSAALAEWQSIAA